VKDTRKAYKKYTNKLTTTMTEERLAQLTEANFPFHGYVGTPTTTKLQKNPVQTMAVKSQEIYYPQKQNYPKIA